MYVHMCTKHVEDGGGAGACVCVLTWVCELCACACVRAWGKQMQLRKRENTDRMSRGKDDRFLSNPRYTSCFRSSCAEPCATAFYKSAIHFVHEG